MSTITQGLKSIRPIEALRLPGPSILRAWARDHGYEISARGRLPMEVEVAYLRAQRQAAHMRSLKGL